MSITIKYKKGKLWEYLNTTGVLENGTEEDIKAAKRAYRKNYLLKYKQRQRVNKPEVSISLSKDKGEYSTISAAAKNHHMSVAAFIRSATIAYINKTFIIPDRYQVARLEQLLSQCLNDIQTIVCKRERVFWGREDKIEAIEKLIIRLESEINEILKSPGSIEELVIKEIAEKPALREQLLFILNAYRNDNQNQIT